MEKKDFSETAGIANSKGLCIYASIHVWGADGLVQIGSGI